MGWAVTLSSGDALLTQCEAAGRTLDGLTTALQLEEYWKLRDVQ
jgi:hypothetical protein